MRGFLDLHLRRVLPGLKVQKVQPLRQQAQQVAVDHLLCKKRARTQGGDGDATRDRHAGSSVGWPGCCNGEGRLTEAG